MHSESSENTTCFLKAWEKVLWNNNQLSKFHIPNRLKQFNPKIIDGCKNIQEIVEARTFGFYKDLKKYQMLGFAKGV